MQQCHGADDNEHVGKVGVTASQHRSNGMGRRVGHGVIPSNRAATTVCRSWEISEMLMQIHWRDKIAENTRLRPFVVDFCDYDEEKEEKEMCYDDYTMRA